MKENKTIRKVGICGLGMVGGALRKWFEKQGYELFLYDKYKEIGFPELLNQADYIYICVPTPTTELGCDISAIDEVLSGLKGRKVVIIKSTIIPGTTDKLQKKYSQHKILFNPEFLTEATPDKDMENPDRQIIGYTNKSRDVAWDIIKQLPSAPVKWLEKTVPSYVAEFVKYAANTYLAMKVAKNNELYDIFKKFGGTEKEFKTLTECVGADTRIGSSHLNIWHDGERGYDGKCLPKDTKAFIKFAKDLKIDLPISSATDKYNDELLKGKGK